jgi:hypothetical protein
LERPALQNNISGAWHANREEISTPLTYGSHIFIDAELTTRLFMQQPSYIARWFESSFTLINVNQIKDLR